MARKNFKLYGPLYGWGSTASRLEPLRERKFSIPKKLYITTDSKKIQLLAKLTLAVISVLKT